MSDMAGMEIQKQDDGVVVKLSGRMDAAFAGQNWSSLFAELERIKAAKLDCSTPPNLPILTEPVSRCCSVWKKHEASAGGI